MKKKTGFLVLMSCVSCIFFEKKKEGFITTSYKDVAKKMDASKAITPATELPLPPFLIFTSLGEVKSCKESRVLDDDDDASVEDH